MAELNEKQKMFCEEYLINGYNATAAYAKVYNRQPGQGLSYAWELLHLPHVQDYIQKRRKEIYDSLCIDRERVMSELASLAFEPTTSGNRTSKIQALNILSRNLKLQSNEITIKDTIEVSLVEDDDESI